MCSSKIGEGSRAAEAVATRRQLLTAQNRERRWVDCPHLVGVETVVAMGHLLNASRGGGGVLVELGEPVEHRQRGGRCGGGGIITVISSRPK